jgi:hypothetical protein
MVRQILVQMPIIGGEEEKGGIVENVSRLQKGTNYVGNKLAPGLPKTAWDATVGRGRTFEGRELDTREGFLMNIVDQTSPLPFETAKEANENAGPIAAIASVLADLNGFTTSTYEFDEAPAGERAKYEKTKDLGYNADDALEEYNAVSTDIWKELQAEGSAPEGYDSFGEFKKSTILDVLTEIRDEEPDAKLIDAQAAAERIFARQYGDLEGTYTRVTNRIRDRLKQDPKIAEALVATGEATAAERQKELATP